MLREASLIDFVHVKRHMDVGGWAFGGCDVFRGEIVEDFDSLMNIFNILRSSIQSIQNAAFSQVYLHFQYICMLIISSWLYPKCTFILLYTTLNLKACKINIEKSA